MFRLPKATNAPPRIPHPPMAGEVSEEWVRELKKGSIQLCLLALLRGGRMYGFQLIKELRERSGGYFDLKEGTAYPALHRLEQRGYVKSEWVTEGPGNPRKYYTLTPLGSRALAAATAEWEHLAHSVQEVLEARS